jgi:hypothetical protein
LHDPAHRHWVSFRFPESIDHFNLVPLQRPRADLPEAVLGPDRTLRRRDGFGLTDARMVPREVLSEIHYCILCHERDKDTCSKGIRSADGQATVNPLGIALAGCPLEEYSVDFVPKTKIEAAVPDSLVEQAIEAIIAAAATGSIGDGKVFVSDLSQAVRIRTGETGDQAL